MTSVISTPHNPERAKEVISRQFMATAAAHIQTLEAEFIISLFRMS